VGVPSCGIFTLYANGDVEKAWDPNHVMAHACIGSGGVVADACIKTLKVTSTLRSWEMLDYAASAAFQSISSVRGPFTTKYLMA
jgi:ATP-dependent protease HslVU (ClpYQ) peptidase subunit